jgi:hypothetical protein
MCRVLCRGRGEAVRALGPSDPTATAAAFGLLPFGLLPSGLSATVTAAEPDGFVTVAGISPG